ncbi:ABC transporter permease [Nonomuraea rubra]|uniref:ABC transporter permease n=1 Tax=Nonomuraea rubra TaxID=46180 RepID=UPI0031E5E762
MIGTDQNLVNIFERPVGKGRPLSETDVDTRRRVAVLGSEVADRLFGELDPIGRQVTVAGARFRVVRGVRHGGADVRALPRPGDPHPGDDRAAAAGDRADQRAGGGRVRAGRDRPAVGPGDGGAAGPVSGRAVLGGHADRAARHGRQRAGHAHRRAGGHRGASRCWSAASACRTSCWSACASDQGDRLRKALGARQRTSWRSS